MGLDYQCSKRFVRGLHPLTVPFRKHDRRDKLFCLKVYLLGQNDGAWQMRHCEPQPTKQTNDISVITTLTKSSQGVCHSPRRLCTFSCMPSLAKRYLRKLNTHKKKRKRDNMQLIYSKAPHPKQPAVAPINDANGIRKFLLATEGTRLFQERR